MNDLEKRQEQHTDPPSRAASLVRLVLWVIGTLGLVLVTAWGITRLLPGLAPGTTDPDMPGPAAAPTRTATPVPYPEISKSPYDPYPVPETPAPYPEDIVFYTVQPGDTLSSIAEKTGLSVEILVDRNNLPDGCTDPKSEQPECALEPGRELILGFWDTLPPTPTEETKTLDPSASIRLDLSPKGAEYPPSPSGELYFVTRPLEPPFIRQLNRVPLDCLVSGEPCLVDSVPGYPLNEDIPISWSPSGEQGLIYDYNQDALLSLDPASKLWRPLEFDEFPVQQVYAYAPGEEWLALSVQGEPYITQIALLRPDGSESRMLPTELPREKFVVGWIDAETLLVAAAQVEIKGTSDVTEPGFYTVDVETNTWETLSAARRAQDNPVLSPDGRTIAYTVWDEAHSQPQAHLMDSASGETWPLEVNGAPQSWSPDEAWIALTDYTPAGQRVSLARQDGSETRVVFEAEELAYPVVWLPGSEQLIVSTYTENLNRVRLYLVSLAGGTPRELYIPDLYDTHELVWPSVRSGEP